jgi:hypothetical protein
VSAAELDLEQRVQGDGYHLVYVRELMALMQRFRVTKLKAGGVELELSPLAFALEERDSTAVRSPVPDGEVMPRPSMFEDDGAGLCSCGHHPASEHTEQGCLVCGCTGVTEPGAPDPAV